uniref:Succinate dehydrogenase assembly factor 2, mitochondrial n=2 Tax=Guillardia theta (strain CCMP2712) TaxID=905079 RepID=A0A0C3U049_GUITC
MASRFVVQAAKRSSSCLKLVRSSPTSFAAIRRPFSAAAGGVDFTSVTNSLDTFDPRKFLTSAGDVDPHKLENLKRALIYRSRQTGWLETDLIMGRWAEANVEKLTDAEIKEYCKIVQCEIIDIFQWIVGQKP